MKLLSNISVDTVGAAFEAPKGGGRQLRDSYVSVYCWATSFGGGTVTVEVSPDGGTSWFVMRRWNENQAIFTISDVYTCFTRGGHVRARLTGSAGASGVNVMVV